MTIVTKTVSGPHGIIAWQQVPTSCIPAHISQPKRKMPDIWILHKTAQRKAKSWQMHLILSKLQATLKRQRGESWRSSPKWILHICQDASLLVSCSSNLVINLSMILIWGSKTTTRLRIASINSATSAKLASNNKTCHMEDKDEQRMKMWPTSWTKSSSWSSNWSSSLSSKSISMRITTGYCHCRLATRSIHQEGQDSQLTKLIITRHSRVHQHQKKRMSKSTSYVWATLVIMVVASWKHLQAKLRNTSPTAQMTMPWTCLQMYRMTRRMHMATSISSMRSE